MADAETGTIPPHYRYELKEYPLYPRWGGSIYDY